MKDIVMKGYVQMRRGLITHLQDGMTMSEFSVFIILLALADKKDGSYKINGAAMNFWTGGEISADYADKVLRSLDKKGYIIRESKQGRTGLYKYYIQKYKATDGVDDGKILRYIKTANGVEKIVELPSADDIDVADDVAEAMAEVVAEAMAEPKAEAVAEAMADKTILETINGKLETGEFIGDDEVEKAKNLAEPLVEPVVSPVAKLTKRFWVLLGSPKEYQNDATYKTWRKATKELIKSHGETAVLETMEFALRDDPFWLEHIHSLTKRDPMDYFVEKYDTIAKKLDAGKKALKATENRAAKLKVQINPVTAARQSLAYNQPEHGGFMDEAEGQLITKPK